MIPYVRPRLPQITSDGFLCCPVCGSVETHCEFVYVAAREEDDETFNEIMVNAITGEIDDNRSQHAPTGEIVGDGNRHRIAIAGFCEEADHQFAVVFTQHKGVTYVEAVAPIPHKTYGHRPFPGFSQLREVDRMAVRPDRAPSEHQPDIGLHLDLGEAGGEDEPVEKRIRLIC